MTDPLAASPNPPDLFAPDTAALRADALRLPAWDLTPRQVADLELLMTGALAPLRGYLGRADFESVCERMRLADGTLWPVPFVLDVTETFAQTLSPGQGIALRHPEGMILAVLTATEAWEPDWGQVINGLIDSSYRPPAWPLSPKDGRWCTTAVMAQSISDCVGLSATPPGHGFVAASFEPDPWSSPVWMLHKSHPIWLGGPLEGIELPPHHAFAHLHLTPAALRERIAALGWRHAAAYDSFGLPSRTAIEDALQVAREQGAGLVIRVVAPPRPIDDDGAYVRLRTHDRILSHYSPGEIVIANLPRAECGSLLRETLLRAIVHRNCGCTHFLVQSEIMQLWTSSQEGAMPAPSAELQGRLQGHAGEIGIYVRVLSRPEKSNEVAAYPEVTEELRRLHPPRSKQGFTVFFTGLSGSGKSTVAQVLVAHLLELGDRRVTLLDGDLVRKHLSSELTFSREHRDLNILRIGFVAGEVTRHGGVAVCAPIAPYAAVRRRVREETERVGGFVEVYVATPLEVCEARDRKGLYAKARAGLLKQFTGVDDPYEAPEHAEIVLDTTRTTPDEAAGVILAYLEREGFLGKSEE